MQVLDIHTWRMFLLWVLVLLISSSDHNLMLLGLLVYLLRHGMHQFFGNNALTDEQRSAGSYYEWDEDAYQADNTTGWVLETPE